MKQEERLDYLLKALCEDSIQYKNMRVEEDEKRIAMRSLMNIRMPKPISLEFTKIQDEFLQLEAIEKGVISWKDIPTIGKQFGTKYEHADKISLWEGDITRLEADAIVNAANSQMLGCFVPCHKCIDNAIHSAAGIELREACSEYMNKMRTKDKSYEEPVGSAMITFGYNLPCKYVIHTVGPIVRHKLTNELRNGLKSCYESCLKTALENGVRSIVFCCISTGEFHFPNDEAAIIAVKAVTTFLRENFSKIDRVIFNVFKDVDKELYEKLFQ